MLLIGARGFLGGHLREAAAAAGLRVIATDRQAADGAPACDLLDPGSVAACLDSARPDLVVNMAGSASVAASWEDPAACFAVNATGVAHLLEAVARQAPAAHVLCVSSAEVYGDPAPDRLPLGEDVPLVPLSPYGQSKAEMEATCERHRERGLRIATVRPFNLVGPGQAGSFSISGFAHRVAAAERSGEESVEIAIRNPGARRDFTDARDAARAFLEASRRELAGTYNLCSGRALGLEALVELIDRASPLPVRTRLDPGPRRPRDPGVVYGDPTRLREATGWEPRIPLERTIADLLDWWRSETAAA
jgi:GDP-4-dehydro-6-deoxy-D-mannose reductase